MKKEMKKGSYESAIEFMRSAKAFTKSMVVAFLQKQGRKLSAAMASATVVMSAREKDSERGEKGNSLGNHALAAHTIEFYLVPCKHVTGEEKKFKFHPCSKDERASRLALQEKREMPKCRQKVEAAAEKARAAKLAKKAKTEAKAAIKATAKLVKSAKATKATPKAKAAPKAPKVVKAKAPKAPAAVAQVKVAAPAPAVAAPAPAVAEVKIAAPAETTLAPTVS